MRLLVLPWQPSVAVGVEVLMRLLVAPGLRRGPLTIALQAQAEGSRVHGVVDDHCVLYQHKVELTR